MRPGGLPSTSSDRQGLTHCKGPPPPHIDTFSERSRNRDRRSPRWEMVCSAMAAMDLKEYYVALRSLSEAANMTNEPKSRWTYVWPWVAMAGVILLMWAVAVE